ncbi:MAG: DUF1987 domain-containing protein [Bacteroidia bacterium]
MMSRELKIDRSDDTPAVLFNVNGQLQLSGRSLPEDAFAFYVPVFDWLNAYIQSPHDPTVLTVNLEYFNTASAKQVFRLISLISGLSKKNKVEVKWHYDEGDKDMRASGERFAKLCGMTFEFVKN